jgi:hypothetical protein
VPKHKFKETFEKDYQITNEENINDQQDKVTLSLE